MYMLRQMMIMSSSLLFLASFSSCAVRRTDDPAMGGNHFEKKLVVAPGGTLTLRTDIGSVTIRGGSGNEVGVLADMHGKESDVSRFFITADQSGNDVQVKGQFQEKARSWFRSVNNFDVQFVITVPHEYNVDVHTSGGTVEVSAVKGTLNGGTSGGDIKVHEIEGPISMETSGGDVSAEHVTGTVRMMTSGGDIRLVALTGDADVKTSGGSIDAESVNGRVDARTSGGNVRLKISGENKGIHAETSGGNIELSIPKAVGAQLDLSTSGGDVTCDMPVTVSGKIREDNIKGTVNGGGSEVYAHTSGGNISLRPE